MTCEAKLTNDGWKMNFKSKELTNMIIDKQNKEFMIELLTTKLNEAEEEKDSLVRRMASLGEDLAEVLDEIENLQGLLESVAAEPAIPRSCCGGGLGQGIGR